MTMHAQMLNDRCPKHQKSKVPHSTQNALTLAHIVAQCTFGKYPLHSDFHVLGRLDVLVKVSHGMHARNQNQIELTKHIDRF